MTVVMAIQREIVKAHGANAAIVHQQIVWTIEYGLATKTAHRPGWFTGSSEELSQMSGLSPDQCRRAMAKLIESGLMVKAKLRANQGVHTCSYRPSEPSDSASGDSAESGSRDFAESRSGDIAESTSTPEEEITNTSPTPPEEGGPPELFGGKSGRPTRREKRAKADNEALQIERVFAPLWNKLPSRDGKTKGKGDRKTARRACLRRLREGTSSGELFDCIENYVAARELYREGWGVEAPVMNGSTFFNSKWDLFTDPWTADDAAEYWPPPPGRDRSEFGKGRRLSVSELLARGEVESEAS